VADVRRALAANVAGKFFVDDTCIDCDTCRQIAPATFRDHGGQSSVHHQPTEDRERFRALKALVACPTASIGTRTAARGVSAAVAAYPERIVGDVHFCGFTSEKTFGGWSYLVLRPPARGGNVLVDSPRFTRPLARRIHEMGGVGTMMLTHRDDVGDHAAFAREFGCTRVMHAADGAARLGIERAIDGTAPVALDRDLVVIPTPGHTRGHIVLLHAGRFLFSGDHLAWSPAARALRAFPDVCWYSWSEQTASMRRLLDHRFEWVLPGHGRIHHADPATMQGELRACIDWMAARRGRRKEDAG
jgi:glyoxylase-like metal-dependent hydrolase (beta-lactamase superfamily II)/ferredoxin